MDAPDEPVEEVVVEAEAWSPEEGTTQVTVVPVDDRLPASADVATAVQRAPGAVVQRLGGLGDWSSVSIRGSAARQVEVFLDGVPLNPEGAGAVNLSELPLRAFEAVHVYRGTVPLHLDSTAIGGAVDLVTGDDPGGRVAVGSGSWNTGRLSAVGSGETPLGEAFFALGALSTDGDFPWFDDRGTRSDPTDDRFVVRDNNGTEQLALHGRWRVGPERARLTLFDGWVHREEGVPGPVFDPWREVAYEVDRHLPTAQLDLQGDGLDAQARVWGLVRSEVLSDPADELFAETEAVRTGAIGARAQVRGLVGPARLATMASVRDDRVDGASVRQVARAGIEAVGSVGAATGSATLRCLGTPRQLRWVPRVGVRIDGGALHAKVGAGGSARIPDLTELYGDRGSLVGNPELRDERGVAADGSVGWAPRAGRIEVGAFHRSTRDRIVWTRNAQGLALPVNIARADATGAEAALSWAPAWLRIDSTGSLVRAVDRRADPAYDGNQLPGIPWVEWFHRTGVDQGWVQVSHDLSFTAGTFTDPANWDLQAPRLLQGITVQVHDRVRAFTVSVDVRNLADRRVQQVPRDPLVDDGQRVPEPLVDFTGYPLPGRTWMVQLAWTPPGQEG